MKHTTHNNIKPVLLLFIVVLAMMMQYARLSTLPTTIFVDLSPTIYIPYIVIFILLLPAIMTMFFILPIFLTLEMIVHIPINQEIHIKQERKVVFSKNIYTLKKQVYSHFMVMRC